jgi:MoxR-like ATPase
MGSSDTLTRVAAQLVGRRREQELVLAAIDAGRHVLIEGPPGTGKSTLLRAIAHELGVGFEFVEGNAELTPARLVGHFDPARVLAEGYDPDVFVDGPLVSALREGALLYVEELNRVPEETLNVLVTVMSERELHVPRLGRVVAAPGFRLVAAMNPFDAVGTARISGAIYDRVCRLSVGYQSAEEEATIVARAVPGADTRWVGQIVKLVRLTREHPDLRVGSSVRGALDATAVASSLSSLRGLPPSDRRVGLDAVLVALSGRIRVREGSQRTPEEIIVELWDAVFGRPGEEASPSDDAEGGSTGKASAPTGAPRG